MIQAVCRNCGGSFGPDDVFCGTCGAARPEAEIPAGPPDDANAHADEDYRPFQPAAPGPALTVTQQPVGPATLTPGGQPMGFFSHQSKLPSDAHRMTNATRYLCAAAYFAPWFTNKVIGELIASHRAVAPSHGIDLEPIIRHCLKARRMKLIRDIVLSVLLLVGLVTATVPLIFILAVTFACSYLPGPRWDRRSFGSKALAALAAAIAALVIGGILVVGVIIIVVLVIVSKVESSAGGGTSLPLSGFFSVGFVGLWSLAYVVLLIGTLVRYFWLRNKTLVEWLQADMAAPAFHPESPRVENRIAEVRQAQYGNLTLYNTEDPFIGTGFIPFELIGKGKKDDHPVWSIAIELSRAGAPRGLLGFNVNDRVDVDPVELHKVLRARLEQLNDPRLPASQRVAYITVDHHVVGEGTFDWSSPLIDRQRMIPYSQASTEAVEALMRAPQGRLRYYQRVSISDEGQPVLTEDRRQVIGSVDREIITSAFIYVPWQGPARRAAECFPRYRHGSLQCVQGASTVIHGMAELHPGGPRRSRLRVRGRGRAHRRPGMGIARRAPDLHPGARHR